MRVTVADLLPRIPLLADLAGEERAALLHHAQSIQCPADAPLSLPGQLCEALAIVVAGTVRVYQVAESGREITLYRIQAGESCVLTASCILSRRPFPVVAATEAPLSALLIPAPVLRAWIAGSTFWREYVFGLPAARLASVITVLEEVAFRRMDARIAELLLARAGAGETLPLTHQQIALELGTAREVVSRSLRDLEREGVIARGRGTIAVLGRERLQLIARQG